MAKKNDIILGLDLTQNIFLMNIFSLPYFALLSDAGLFELIIYKVLKKVKIGVLILCSLTVPLAVIATLMEVCHVNLSYFTTFVITMI